jgi:sporulation protein YlmC with PRC-barrel domain
MERETKLLETSRVPGTPVFSMSHDNIGEVDELVVDTETGKVRYGILSFGGLLGIGKRYFPIPWRAMRWHPELGGYVVGITQAQLESAPGYDPKSWENRDWEKRIHLNYETPAYWESDRA